LIRHGPNRRRVQQYLVRVFVAAGTCIPRRCLVAIRGYAYRHKTDERDLWYAIEIGSGAVIYKASFIKFVSGIQKLIAGKGYTDRMEIA
jgi:hypothetical protein